MRGEDVVDLEIDPAEARRALRRRLMRYGISLFCIVLVAAGLIGSTLYTSAMNRSDVLALSRDFIDTINARVQTEVQAYLLPAEDSVSGLVAALPPEPFSPEGLDLFERMAQDALSRHTQLASVYLGTPDGEFLMVRRNDAGGADTKLIRRTPAGPDTMWTRRDASGAVLGVEKDDADRYDPRTRPWYRDARDSDRPSWSKVYLFFTDKSPGITVSNAVRAPGRAPVAVVGADIYLKNLSAFLATLQAQARGTLAIVNGDGEIVAFHEPERVMTRTDGGLQPQTLRELGLNTLAEAFDRMRVEGPSRSIIEIDGDRYVFGAASLKSAVSRDWWLMLLAPERAYLGFIAVNSRRGLMASSGIIVLSILLAGFLTYQGVVAERNARAAQDDRARLQLQRRIFDDLASLAGLSDPQNDDDLKEASALLSRAEGARRVSFWQLSDNGLLCLDAFDSDARGHTSGTRLVADDCGELFGLVLAGRFFEVDVADADPRASRLRRTYLCAVGTTSLASVPIVGAGRALGAVWIEDPNTRAAASADRSLARSLANLLAPRLATRSGTTGGKRLVVPAPADPDAASDASHRVHHENLPATEKLRTATLVERRHRMVAESRAGTGATLLKGTTVLALKLRDDRSLAAFPAGASDGAVIREVVSTFKREAEKTGIPYVKILTDLVLAVDGFGEDAPQAAERLMDVALHVRESCNAVFLAVGQGPQFAMGVDSGAAYGTTVGFGDSPYNVWGEPARIARMLAETADPGTIQVSEVTYELLQEVGVFRRRGAFFVGQVGEMTTFTLRGRL
jgi:adenylate cyclase